MLAFETRITLEAADNLEAAPKRQISGVAAPWNTIATDRNGTRFMLLEGALPVDGPAPKLIRDHNLSEPIGIVSGRTATATGMDFTARISNTAAGNDALTLAADGVLDAVSVGISPTDYVWQDGVMVVAAADWAELSLVPFGAFQAAKVTQVAATPAEPANNLEAQPNKEVETVETEPTVATAPLVITAGATKPNLTAAGYLSLAAAGRYDEIQAAVAQQTTTDTPGILPDPFVGAVYDNLKNIRPFIDAVGVLAMPANGSSFQRRKVTQHVTIGQQVAQFDELASQKMTIAKVTVNKGTYGGAIALSEQDVDWTDGGGALNLALTDLGKVYAKQTETVATAALVAGATVTHNIVNFADGDEVLDAFYDAAALINSGIDELPTHLFVSADMWASLGKAKTANNERLFPVVGPMNAAGSMNPGSFTVTGLGLRVVVSPRFAAATCIIGNPVGIELYENNKGSIRVENPATLSTTLAWRGYFASVVLDANAFVKFT